MKKVAIIGTVGVPAAYGGFETLVENIIGENCSEEVAYTVFCSSKDCPQQLESYKGAKLVYIPFKANGVWSIVYDGISLLKAIRGFDVVVVLGVSGGIFFPLFRLLCRSKFIVNIDGLEWKREKWNRLAKGLLHLSERLALRTADVVIADNQGIVDYISPRFKKKTVLIAYGSDHVKREVSVERSEKILSSYGVCAKGYAISLCRIEPENNCEMILQSFATNNLPLIFVGNWDKSDYGIQLKKYYSQFANIQILDAIYDLDTLYVLRSNSKCYVHGHSAGGTNPSLVEAMFCGCNIAAYDVVYNRETTEGKAMFFKNGEELVALTTQEAAIDNSPTMQEIAAKRYMWATIAKQYEALYD